MSKSFELSPTLKRDIEQSLADIQRVKDRLEDWSIVSTPSGYHSKIQNAIKQLDNASQFIRALLPEEDKE